MNLADQAEGVDQQVVLAVIDPIGTVAVQPPSVIFTLWL